MAIVFHLVSGGKSERTCNSASTAVVTCLGASSMTITAKPRKLQPPRDEGFLSNRHRTGPFWNTSDPTLPGRSDAISITVAPREECARAGLVLTLRGIILLGLGVQACQFFKDRIRLWNLFLDDSSAHCASHTPRHSSSPESFPRSGVPHQCTLSV